MITDLATMTNISKSFYLQDGGKNQLEQIWNKIRTSLTLCHEIYSCYQVITAQLDNIHQPIAQCSLTDLTVRPIIITDYRYGNTGM